MKKIESPLLAAVMGGAEHHAEKKAKSKNTASPKASRKPPAEQAFDGMPKPPTMAERHRENARYAKLNATRDWVEGRISTNKHEMIHSRANHVLKHGGPGK